LLQFLNPGLLIGAALLAVPLVIHLLNRQRYKRRPWAAMEFLLAAYRKQRRRLRRENLLLLLLRCAIPVALALAISRPLWRAGGDLVGGGGGSAHHVLVVDASYSMGLQLPSAASPFERAKALATGLLDRIGSREGQPRVTLVVQGVRPAVPFREEIDLERAKARIAALGPPVDAGPPLTDALAEAAEIVEAADDAELRVHVFTDLQVRAFGEDPFATDPLAGDPRPAEPTDPAEPGTGPAPDEPSAAMFRDTAADAIRRIREKAEVTIFDVRGAPDGGLEDNLQIVDLRLDQAHAIARVPLPVIVTVRNRSDVGRVVQVTLEIDGSQPTRRSVQVEAGSDGEAEFEISLREVGLHRLRASLDGDALAVDDERFAVIEVRERLRVLVVEGSGEQDPGLRTSTHLVEILDPTGGEGPPDLTWFEPVVVDAVAFLSGRTRPEDFDLVVLADLERLDRQSADALADAVRGGTGLFVMLGRHTDPDSFNEFLHRGGLGPMPMTLTGAQGYTPESDRWFGSLVERRDHPVLRDFAEDVYVEILESVPIWRFVGAERPPAPAAEAGFAADPADPEQPERVTGEVLLSIRDPARSPLWVASRFGAGKALFATTPISREPVRWNRFDAPVAGLSFLLLWPAAEWLTVPAVDARNVVAGGALAAVVGDRPTDLAIVPPEDANTGKVPIGDDAEPLLGGRYALPPYRRTEQAGFYDFEMLLGEDAGSAERHVEQFAVNPEVAEGELAYLSHQSAKERLGVKEILTELPASATASIDAGVDELGPLFLWLTLAFLLGEAGLARFVSRRRT
jgi:hypothetical protein